MKKKNYLTYSLKSIDVLALFNTLSYLKKYFNLDDSNILKLNTYIQP